MAFGFSLGHTTAPRYVVFGKLPKCADFVRVNAAHPVVIEFDRSVADSLDWARKQPSWSDDAYLAADPCDFHFISRDRRWALLGVMHPSKDAAGRSYPLVAGIVLPVAGVASHAYLFPIVGELFFSALREQLRNAVENSSELLACRQFLELQLMHPERLDADIELADAVLERHLEQTSAASLQRVLDECGGGTLEAHLLTLIFYGPLFRRYAGSAPLQAIPLPLPERPGEWSLGVSTWLALHRAACPETQSTMPHYVVLGGAGRCQLALAPEGISGRFLTSAWGMQPEPSTLVNVCEDRPPWMLHQSYAEASYILGRQLADPGLSLRALREIIQQLARIVA